jgi:hypothetical protein
MAQLIFVLAFHLFPGSLLNKITIGYPNKSSFTISPEKKGVLQANRIYCNRNTSIIQGIAVPGKDHIQKKAAHKRAASKGRHINFCLSF